MAEGANLKKYGAVQVLAAFSARLRDEVGSEPLSVVHETVWPAHASSSLWLRSTLDRRLP